MFLHLLFEMIAVTIVLSTLLTSLSSYLERIPTSHAVAMDELNKTPTEPPSTRRSQLLEPLPMLMRFAVAAYLMR